MGLIKLAVYGALGYLAYQTFFSDSPASGGNQRGSQSRGNGGQGRGEKPRSGGRPQRNPAGQFTGGGEGRPEQTAEATGASMSHRVGRGVIS